MNAIIPPIPLIPENAPFSPAQRAWLNGFLAGLYGNSNTQSSIPLSTPAESPPEDFPWHDPVLELPERLALAEGRALPQRLMAAMGQLDCGQCGYMCQSYAAALAEGREGSISLCVPGAKPTQLALKRLMAEAPAILAAPRAQTPASPIGREVQISAAEPLTGPGSSKDVRHVIIDLRDSGLTYAPGDLGSSLAVPNDSVLVEATLAALGTSDDKVRAALTTELDIARPLDRTLDLLAGAAVHPRHAAALRALAEGEAAAEPADADLLDLLEAFPSARPPLQDLLRSLPPLRPRLYSIASSQSVTPTEVHLCVAVVRDMRRSRLRHGVASAFLADRATQHEPVRAFVQTSHFRLPTDPRTHVIMCGPGTGVAPFRAFLQRARGTSASEAARGCCSANASVHTTSSTRRNCRRGSPMAHCRASMSRSRAISRPRITCNIAWPRTPRTCGAGSRTAPTSMSAAMRHGWRAMSMPRCAASP